MRVNAKASALFILIAALLVAFHGCVRLQWMEEMDAQERFGQTP